MAFLRYAGVMARPRRIEFPGALYHLTSRGNAQEPIYNDDHDRETFLSLLAQTIRRYHFLVFAYCLMDNHYHLLIETQEANLSLGMRYLNGLYTQRFNRRYRRVGHLFQGRFKAILVEKESHLLELCRYVVLNPVRAGVVEDPIDWLWSSYRATLGKILKPWWLSCEAILRLFHSHRSIAQDLYHSFVLAGLRASSPWEKLKGQIYLGSDTFCQRFQQEEPIPEIPRLQRQPVRPELAEIFRNAQQATLPAQTLLAYRTYGYRLREIAEYLHVYYTTVSRWLCAAESRETNIQELQCKT